MDHFDMCADCQWHDPCTDHFDPHTYHFDPFTDHFDPHTVHFDPDKKVFLQCIVYLKATLYQFLLNPHLTCNFNNLSKIIHFILKGRVH